MNKHQEPEIKDHAVPAQEDHEKTRFKTFLDRLTILHHTPHLPIRTWLAWAGVLLFVALVIAYYVVNGG